VAPFVDLSEVLVVALHVRDMARSKVFYRQLGFDLVEDRGTVVTLAWHGRRLVLIEDWDLSPPRAHPRASVRVLVPDVDRHWLRVRAMGVRVVEPIEDRDYGLRDFTILDPDGIAVSFATRLP
jgi:catechol 2,3-dioxygenase-like lactoylglutathione lyase family enzyme